MTGASGGQERDQPQRSAVLRVAADAREFEGHFPGRPLLPGAALLGRVLVAVGEVTGEPFRLRSVRRLRWRRPVLPGALLLLSWTGPAADGWLRFELQLDQDRACSGELRVEAGP